MRFSSRLARVAVQILGVERGIEAENTRKGSGGASARSSSFRRRLELASRKSVAPADVQCFVLRRFGAPLQHRNPSPSTVFFGHPRETMATFFNAAGGSATAEPAGAPTPGGEDSEAAAVVTTRRGVDVGGFGASAPPREDETRVARGNFMVDSICSCDERIEIRVLRGRSRCRFDLLLGESRCERRE